MEQNGTTNQNRLYRVFYNRVNKSIKNKDTADIEYCYFIADSFWAGQKITQEQYDEITTIMDNYMEEQENTEE